MIRTPIIRRTPLKRVSAKRAKQLREYSKRRKAFLAANPTCGVFSSLFWDEEGAR